MANQRERRQPEDHGFWFHLSNARQASGLSIRQLAEISGVPSSILARLEKSGGDPKLSDAIALAKALGVRLEDLIDRRSGQAPPTIAPAKLERLRTLVEQLSDEL